MIFKIFILVISIGCYASAETNAEAEPKAAGLIIAPELRSDAPKQIALQAIEPSKAKSLESQEAITLFRHDKSAGVYRTESGDLVRMYRVERANPARRVAGMPNSEETGPSDKQRMFGDWFSNYYNNPYSGLSTYSYNYNYGYNNPYGNYYNPYNYYQNNGYWNPYGGLGMLGYGY